MSNSSPARILTALSLMLGAWNGGCDNEGIRPTRSGDDLDAEAVAQDAEAAADGSSEVPAPKVAGPSGVVRPRFYVARIIYAPTGSKFRQCLGAGSVKYRAGSSLGTVLSPEGSFVDGYEVSALEPPDEDERLVISEYTPEGAGLDIAKPSSLTLTLDGDCESDGVDHDLDYLEVWFRPRVHVTVGDTAVSWWLEVSSPYDFMELSVHVLKQPERMSENDRARLEAWGVYGAGPDRHSGTASVRERAVGDARSQAFR